jgi:hypothetical protein
LDGHERHPDLIYPDQQFLYYFCAKEFGWTIEETDNQPAGVLDYVIAIHNAVGEKLDNKQSESS